MGRQLRWVVLDERLAFRSARDRCLVCGNGVVETPDGLTCGQRECRETLPDHVSRIVEKAAVAAESYLDNFKKTEYLPLVAERQTLAETAEILINLLQEMLPPADDQVPDSVALNLAIMKLADLIK